MASRSKQADRRIDLSLVIPIYNGAAFLERTTNAYFSALKKSPLIRSFEIILVTNNCSDESPAIAAKRAKKIPQVKHFDYAFKTLKGGAVIRGFQHARFPLVGFTDVDMSTSPHEFLKLVPSLEDEKVGAVIASRQMHDSVLHPPQTFARRFLGWGFAALREILFGLEIRDSQCGAKIFRSEAITPFTLTSNGFTFDVELLRRVKQHGMSIREIGIHWKDHEGSTVTLFSNFHNSPFYMLWELIKLRLSV